MKGLLYKDLMVVLDSARMMAVIVVLFLVTAMAGNGFSMVSSMMALLVVTLAISSFSYDDLAHWDIFAATLPISRRKLVLSKYVFLLLLGAGALVLNVVLAFVTTLIAPEADFQFQIATGLLSTLVACILDIAIIPLIYKFGAEKSRILLMGAMALIFVLGFGVLRVLPALSIDTEAISFTALALGLIVVFAAAFLISWFCSVKIVEKKEY